MAMTKLQALARAEHEADLSKGTATAAWRKTWWAVTHELGVQTAGLNSRKREDRDKLTTAYNTVQAETGQNRRWLADRAKTGRFLARLKSRQREELPPKLSVQIIARLADDDNRSVDEIVALLRGAEDDGKTLRQATKDLTGEKWADDPEVVTEKFVSDPDQLEQFLRDHPEACDAVSMAVVKVQAEAEDERADEEVRQNRAHAEFGPYLKLLAANLKLRQALDELLRIKRVAGVRQAERCEAVLERMEIGIGYVRDTLDGNAASLADEIEEFLTEAESE